GWWAGRDPGSDPRRRQHQLRQEPEADERPLPLRSVAVPGRPAPAAWLRAEPPGPPRADRPLTPDPGPIHAPARTPAPVLSPAGPKDRLPTRGAAAAAAWVPGWAGSAARAVRWGSAAPVACPREPAVSPGPRRGRCGRRSDPRCAPTAARRRRLRRASARARW